MAVSYEVKEYSTFGKCVCIDNGVMELYVTVDVGPRIIKLNIKGKENVMFNDIEHRIYDDQPDLQAMFGTGKQWNVQGGHRFWVSPEKHPQTYYPDNEPVEYTVKGNTFSFYPPKQIFTGWQEILEITMDEDSAKADVKHILINMSDTTQTGGIWGISVTAKGSAAYVKQSAEDTGLLPNRTLMLWPYDVATDDRFYMDDEFVGLKQDVNVEIPFKLGTNNTNGVSVCVNNGTVFKVICDYVYGEEYPDNGCSCEMYSCADYLEVEKLSPLYTMKPGERCEHIEKWELYPENSTDITDLKKYF